MASPAKQSRVERRKLEREARRVGAGGPSVSVRWATEADIERFFAPPLPDQSVVFGVLGKLDALPRWGELTQDSD